MANIQTFQAPAISIRPTETGIETVAGNARRLGAFYNQGAGALDGLASDTKSDLGSAGRAIGGGIAAAGEAYVNYLDHKEISAFSAESTGFMQQATDDWNKIISDPKMDPNNPKPAQDFLAGFETKMQNLSGSDYLTTEKSRDFAEKFVERFRQHMTEKTSADLSTLAGVALKVNVQKTVNSLASMAASDPSSLDFALASVDHAIDAKVSSAPTLDAATAASVRGEVGLKAKQDIVKSAVVGMITKNPNIDLDAIQKKYGEYVSGAEMKMFAKTAQTQAKVDAYHDKSAQIAQRQLDDLNVHQSATDTITKNVSVDPQTGTPVIKPQFFNDALEIARKNPNAPSAAATVRTMLDWGESQMNKEKKAVDDAATVSALSSKLFDPNSPTTELDLMRAQTKGLISDHTFQQLSHTVKELGETPLKGPIYQDTMKAAHSALVLTGVGIPGKDDAGEKNYAMFVQHFIPQYLAAYRDGSLPPNALDVKDPKSMISQSMEPFKRTVLQRVQDYTSTLGGVPRNDAMPAIPAPDQRNVGSIYETPRGKMKWTGTGWVNP